MQLLPLQLSVHHVDKCNVTGGEGVVKYISFFYDDNVMSCHVMSCHDQRQESNCIVSLLVFVEVQLAHLHPFYFKDLGTILISRYHQIPE
jgi:hypothetical protein